MDAERLLGSLLGGGLRRGTRGVNKAALAMGAIGVAMAAWEHYQQQQRSPAGSQGIPPPPPGTGPAIPPPPPAAARPDAAGREALLLIRAMVAAAHADGQFDAEERSRVLDRARAAGLDGDDQAHLEATLSSPATIDELVGEVTSPDLAEQVYIVSLLAIRPDTDAEKHHLAALARALAFDASAVARLHRLAGAPAP